MTRTPGAERQARARARRKAGIPAHHGPTPLADRFWAKVDRRGADECWPWTAALNEHGYGVMRPETDSRNGPTIKAHRVSLMLHGVDPTGLVVLHSCDNPPCVNPAHLSVGTQLDNVHDCQRKGRDRRARKVPREAWDEIKGRAAAGELHRIIAADYGVCRATITVIVNAVTPPSSRDLMWAVVESLGGAA